MTTWSSEEEKEKQKEEGKEPRAKESKVILEERYFRRMEQFGGDLSRLRGWTFDLLVAIGQVDKGLEGIKQSDSECAWGQVGSGNR